jgi:hypothetical protein
MSKIIKFPEVVRGGDVAETLDTAKGWDFRHVVVIGTTKEGGSKEGTVLVSTNGGLTLTAKDKLFMAELLRWIAMKELGFYD